MINSFQAHDTYINHIKQSPFKSDFVATCSGDNTTKIWNITTPCWTLYQTYMGLKSSINDVEFINDDLIVAGGYDMVIQIWSIRTGLTNRTLSLSQSIWSLKLLSNGYYLACGLQNFIQIYHIFTGSLISTLIGHSANVRDMTNIMSDLMASSSQDNTTRIWNLTTNSTKFVLTGHTSDVYGLKLISLDILASSSNDKTIKLWNITSGYLINTLSSHTSYITWSMDTISNSQILVSGSGDNTIKLWDISTGSVLKTFDTNLEIRALTVLSITAITGNQQQSVAS